MAFLNDRNDLLIAGGKYFGPDAEPRRDARIWRASLDADGGYVTKRIVQQDIDSYRHAATTPDGARVIVCAAEGRSFFKVPALRPGQTTPPQPRLDRWQLISVIQLRDTKTGKLIWTIDGSLAGTVDALDVSPDGKHIAYCLDNSVFVVSTASGEPEYKIVP